jgi:hypothetical protein
LPCHCCCNTDRASSYKRGVERIIALSKAQDAAELDATLLAYPALKACRGCATEEAVAEKRSGLSSAERDELDDALRTLGAWWSGQ